MIQYQNLMQVNSSSKRKRGTASERLEILEKDFTLEKLFKSNIDEVNLIDCFSILLFRSR